MVKTPKPMGYEQALLQMSELCARSEQCEFDLREKMRKKLVPAADADRVIDYLYDNNFLNVSRFARAYCRDKHRFNGWGRIKIRMMLAAKRIPAAEIKGALSAIEQNEYLDTLGRLLTAKAKGLNLNDRADRARLLRSLYAKGYEPGLIIAAMQKLGAEADEDEADFK